jgi:hypothetical protein
MTAPDAPTLHQPLKKDTNSTTFSCIHFHGMPLASTVGGDMKLVVEIAVRTCGRLLITSFASFLGFTGETSFQSK